MSKNNTYKKIIVLQIVHKTRDRQTHYMAKTQVFQQLLADESDVKHDRYWRQIKERIIGCLAKKKLRESVTSTSSYDVLYNDVE
jgi:hypothetical protein